MCMPPGFVASLRNDTSFTSRPVEIADTRGEARTLAGALLGVLGTLSSYAGVLNCFGAAATTLCSSSLSFWTSCSLLHPCHGGCSALI